MYAAAREDRRERRLTKRMNELEEKVEKLLNTSSEILAKLQQQ